MSAQPDRMRIGGAWYEKGSWWVKPSRAVSALVAQGGEIAESVGVTFADMPEGFDGLILAVPSRSWAAHPGRYLLFHLPDEEAP